VFPELLSLSLSYQYHSFDCTSPAPFICSIYHYSSRRILSTSKDSLNDSLVSKI
jgi:hypothetical protein